MTTFIFILALLNFSMAWAEPLALPSSECSCNAELRDRLEDPAKFNFGQYAGKCVDSCRHRRSKFVPAAGLPKSLDGLNEVTISNYLHEGKYWIAQVPFQKVESADVGFEEFMPGIFHVFLEFHFPKDAPVILTPQIPKKGVAPLKIQSLVLSSEGIPPKEGAYNFVDAYMGRYMVGVRILSHEEVINWSVKGLKHKVSWYELQLETEQIRKILIKGLNVVERDSFQVKYGLFSNNCATKALDLIDDVVNPEVASYPIYYKLFYPLERSLPVAGPLGTFHVFRSRNLILPEAKLIL